MPNQPGGSAAKLIPKRGPTQSVPIIAVWAARSTIQGFGKDRFPRKVHVSKVRSLNDLVVNIESPGLFQALDLGISEIARVCSRSSAIKVSII